MSKKFYAINRETGERWKPNVSAGINIRHYLVMYDSGYLAEVKEDFYTYITPLDNKTWEIIIKDNIIKNGTKNI